MGWERKRGKLSEFNRLIRGDRSTNYTVLSGDPATLPGVRYIITLDADTILPRESARRLVGTIAHPLNAPGLDPAKGRVVEGYGVLQPRVSYHLFAATRSRFAALLASSAGIDPYANAVSDAYMDLFGLGTLHRQGDLRPRRLRGAPTGTPSPTTAILSHDLIEGNYARCGLVTDVELFDDFPPRYHAYALREHRWARGDWQLLPWSGRTVPTATGSGPNPLPLLERWKVLDNLRRSLVAAEPRGAAGPGLDGLARLALALDRRSRWRSPPCRSSRCCLGHRTARSGRGRSTADARGRPQLAGHGGPVAALDRLPGRPGRPAPRRDRPDLESALRSPEEHAGVGNRRGDRAPPRHRDRQLLPDDVVLARRSRSPSAGSSPRVRPAALPAARRSWPPGSSPPWSPTGSAGPSGSGNPP